MGCKRAIVGRKIERVQKKVVKKILGYETKTSRGGRHPSYDTEWGSRVGEGGSRERRGDRGRE